jgi:hypothetical protein
MPSLSSGNRIPVEDATTRVPLIIDWSKSQTGAADFTSYITRQLQGQLDPRVALDAYHHRSMENLGLQAPDLFA